MKVEEIKEIVGSIVCLIMIFGFSYFLLMLGSVLELS